MIPLIAVAFLLLAALLLALLLGSGRRWPVKLAAVVIVPLYAIAVWHALATFTGWPTRVDEPPARVVYVASLVREPSASSGGTIYLWATPPSSRRGPLDHRPEPGEPRAYRLPYTRQLHEALQGADDATRDGRRVELVRVSDRRGSEVRYEVRDPRQSTSLVKEGR